MSFTDAELVSLRFYCGFSAKGSPTGYALGIRFYPAYGAMEYRMQNLTVEEEGFVRIHFLTPLAHIETEWLNTVDNLDTDVAAVWKRNKAELSEKRSIYMRLRKDLCAYFGLMYGGDLYGTDAQSFGIKI